MYDDHAIMHMLIVLAMQQSFFFTIDVSLHCIGIHTEKTVSLMLSNCVAIAVMLGLHKIYNEYM